MADMNKLGSLWQKESPKAGTYFTGTIKIAGVEMPLVVFANRKTKDTQPDWTIFESKPKDGQ